VDGSIDPTRDMEVISLELVLADLDQVERRLAKASKDKKTDPNEVSALNKVSLNYGERVSATCMCRPPLFLLLTC